MAALAGRGAEARRVAVVGGGVSGLFCASTLSQYGYHVSLFDMGKAAPGGRMTTRHTAWKGLQFDHGCQFIRASTTEFRAVVDEWTEAGVATPWSGRIGVLDAGTGTFTPREDRADGDRHTTSSSGDSSSSSSSSSSSGSGGVVKQPISSRGAGAEGHLGFAGVLGPGALYTGVPSMDAVCSHLAAHGGISTVRSDVKVTRALLDPDGKWLLEGRIRQPLRTAAARKQEAPFTPWNLGVYDALVLADRLTACPGTPGHVDVSAPSSAAKLLERMRDTRSDPCIALMLGFQDAPVPLLPFDAASVSGSDALAWVALDSSKPGRERSDGVQCLIALATRGLSRRLVQHGADGALPPQTPELLAALAAPMHAALHDTLAHAGVVLPPPAFIQAHRWGSAFPARPIAASCLRADSARLVACGDFCLPGGGGAGGVEAAVLSARAAADAVRRLFEA